MIRVLLDTNVLVAMLSAEGAPAEILRAWQHGAFELVVSNRLLEEFVEVTARPAIRRAGVDPADAATLVARLRIDGVAAEDEPDPPVFEADPKDAYLVALARAAAEILVTGDRTLRDSDIGVPVLGPREFLDALGAD
ncbi:MAG TPA: PIN domain-containing protein [Actinomycetota bacterium]